MKSIEIYFNDLNEEKQSEVLKFYDMQDESEGNWEVQPLAILEVEDEPQEKFSWDIEKGFTSKDGEKIKVIELSEGDKR